MHQLPRVVKMKIIIKKWSSVFWNSGTLCLHRHKEGKRGEREERNPRNYTPNDWKHVKTVKCENSWADTVWCLQQPVSATRWSLTPGQVSPHSQPLICHQPSMLASDWLLLVMCPLSQTWGSCNMHRVTWHGNIAWEKHLIAFCRHITPHYQAVIRCQDKLSPCVFIVCHVLPVIRGKCLLNTGSWAG